MPISDFQRKWWHLVVDIEDRNMTVLKSLTTIDPIDPNLNADANISARLLDCSGTVSIPPRAWDINESAGYFLPRPDIEQLESAFKNISSYDEAINIDNRRVFKYKLRAAYNEFDTDCTAVVPTTMDPANISIITENQKSIVFKIAEMEYLDSIGCCDIEISEPPDPLPLPSDMSECSRLWYIVDDSGTSHLYSFDVDQPLISAIVDRGEIYWPFGGGVDTLEYHDLAWDDRNFLWGLETNGLTRLLIGDSSTSAFAMNYALITNPFSATVYPFPISSPIPQGYAAMSYNQNNGKLYIFSNQRFWELEPSTDVDWEVTQMSYEFGENEKLGDLAFGPDGKCYCFHNNKLATVVFDNSGPVPFGFISYVGGGGEYSDFIGLDFIVEIADTDQATLYGVKTTGQIYYINTENATKTLYAGASLGDVAVGTSSCQAGEDLRTLPFPFFPGVSPWLFIVDNSASMSGERLERLKEGLSDFISQYVRRGDQLSIIAYSTGFTTFSRLMQNQDDAEAAISFIDSMSAIGGTDFCSAFNIVSDPSLYHDLKSIVVISNGVFDTSDCGTWPDPQQQNLTDTFNVIHSAGHSPDVIVYAVGITPDPNTEPALQHLGQIGGGGYIRWD